MIVRMDGKRVLSLLFIGFPMWSVFVFHKFGEARASWTRVLPISG
jgi:hypothetical protein